MGKDNVVSLSDYSGGLNNSFTNNFTPQKARETIIQNFEKGMISEELFAAGMESCDILEKGGKRATIGEIRTYSGKKYQKTVEGWTPVKEGNPDGEKSEKGSGESNMFNPSGYATQDFLDHLTKNVEKIWPNRDFNLYSDIKVRQVGSAKAKYIEVSGKNKAGVRVRIADTYLDGNGTNFGAHQVSINNNIKSVIESFGKK